MNDNPPQNEVPQFSIPFGNKLVELADIDEGATVLDMGMGNGLATFFPALKKVGEQGQVIGIDISRDMVKETYRKIKKELINNATVLQTDAKSLAFKDNAFDVVVCGFSYLCTTPEEILRVLKKGGTFGLTSWRELEDMEWMAAFLRKYFAVTTHDVCYQDTEEGLREFLCKAGFENVTIMTERQEFAYRDEEQWWEEMRDSGWESHLRKIESLGPDSLEKFKKEAFEGLQKYKRDGLHFCVDALIGVGTKRYS